MRWLPEPGVISCLHGGHAHAHTALSAGCLLVADQATCCACAQLSCALWRMALVFSVSRRWLCLLGDASIAVPSAKARCEVDCSSHGFETSQRKATVNVTVHMVPPGQTRPLPSAAPHQHHPSLSAVLIGLQASARCRTRCSYRTLRGGMRHYCRHQAGQQFQHWRALSNAHTAALKQQQLACCLPTF